MSWVISYQYLLLVKQTLDILRTLGNFLVDIEHKERAGSSFYVRILFEEWVRELNKKFQIEERQVALIIDNCPTNPIVQNLSHVKLTFLPPNTTSVTKPIWVDGL